MIRHAPSIGIGIGLSLRSQGFGVSYVKAGRVLDYSTDVGPFTIVDQSGEGNTATLYSGRGLTMDGVGDLIDFGSPTFSEPVTSMTGYARSTDTSINLGLTSATLAGNDTWETFSADTAAKDYGDSLWFNGTDNYIVADPANFNPSAAGQVVNLKWITNTGATSAEIIWGYRDQATELIQITQQNDTTVVLQVRGSNNIIETDTITVQAGQYISGTLTYDGVAKTAAFTSNVGTASVSGFGTISASTKLTVGATFGTGSYDVFLNGTIIQSSTNGVDDLTDGTPVGTFVTAAQHFTNPDFILGTGYNGDLSDVRCLGATGTVLGHWSLADWSNPTGDTSNGKTIVDSGPNQLHGTCTGCSGFTGEGIDPLFAPITDETLPYFAGDNAASVGFSDVTFAGDLAVSFKTHMIDLDGTSGTIDGAHFLADIGGSARIYFDGSSSGGGAVAVADDAGNTSIWQNESALVAGVDYDVQVTRISGVWNLTINGIDKAAPTFGSASGTVTLNSWGARRGTATSITALNGVIYDINLGSAAWGGGTPYTDTIGSNDGTPVGTFVTVGQKRATIPQTADKNWNKYQWFNGTNAYVSVAGMTATTNYFGACTISADIYIKDASATATICALGSDAYRILISAGTWRLNSATNTAVSVVAGINQVSVDFNSAGSAVSLSINSVEVWTGTATSSSSATTFLLGARTPATPGLFWDGTISNFSLSGSLEKNFAYTGLGNDPWADTIGSNDGTESGTFTRELVSASDANIQIDALGTAISQPRLNTQQLNLFGEGEHSRTPDSASLDLTTTATWELWGNFYGTSATAGIIGKNNSGASKRSFLIVKHSANAAGELRVITSDDGIDAQIGDISGLADKVNQLVVTLTGGVWAAYIDGVSATFATGTLHSSLAVNDVPVEIGTNTTSAVPYSGKIGSAKIYNVALTADEVLTNYNTQKSKYGL